MYNWLRFIVPEVTWTHPHMRMCYMYVQNTRGWLVSYQTPLQHSKRSSGNATRDWPAHARVLCPGNVTSRQETVKLIFLALLPWPMRLWDCSLLLCACSISFTLVKYRIPPFLWQICTSINRSVQDTEIALGYYQVLTAHHSVWTQDCKTYAIIAMTSPWISQRFL